MAAVCLVAGLFVVCSDESLSPAESLAKIQLPAGLTVELAACEPNVESPVAISFDERGRMFVAEYRDYPLGPPKGESPLSRIRLLEDKDGDGFFETATIFTDHLNFAQGVLAIQGGAIVTAAPDILFLKDTNGDGVADEKKVLFTGFKAGNPQLRVSHPRLGIDNLVYVSNGLSGGEIHHVAAKGPIVTLTKDDFRFDPKTMIGEATTGFGQFGNTFDDWGRRFTCSNRNPVMHSILPKRVLNRNDQIPIPQGYYDVAPSGADAKVYPIARTSTTAESHAGTNTAACGVHVYRGDLLGQDYRGDVFVCEPTGFLVTRYWMSRNVRDGAGFSAERVPETGREFLASTDTWFRPVSLADGPDGALYVVDMHREVVEHPQYLPEGVGKGLRFRAGAEKGRIIRIKLKDAKARPYQPPKGPGECVSMLRDKNGWRRDVAHRMLVENPTPEALRLLRNAERDGSDYLPAHAVWILRGWGALTADDFIRTYFKTDGPDSLACVFSAFEKDKVANFRELQDSGIINWASSLDGRVAFVAICLWGDSEHPERLQELSRAAIFHRKDPWVLKAIQSACAPREGELFSMIGALAAKRDKEPPTPQQSDLVAKLCSAAVHRDEMQLRVALAGMSRSDSDTGWKIAALLGMAEGLRRPNPWKARGIAEFLRSPPKSLESETLALRPLLLDAERAAFDRGRPINERVAAVKLVGFRLDGASLLLKLIDPSEPAVIQIAAIQSADGQPKPVVDRIIAQWPSLPPAVQQAAVEFCFRRRDSQKMLLEAIAAGKASASAIGAERREMMLVFSRDEEMKALARKLFRASTSNRAALIDQYLPSTKQKGAASKGAEVFKRVCASCHRLKGVGVAVGPELADVRQKAKETLLFDILDPNRTVEPRYTSYIAALADGRTVVGLLSSETSASITLKLANGIEEDIRRDQIEQFRSSGRSLMPEGVEKDVTPAQMADLLEFLCSPN